MAQAWADQGWPAELDETGVGITAGFNAPSQGPPPWNVYRIKPRSVTVVLVRLVERLRAGGDPGRPWQLTKVKDACRLEIAMEYRRVEVQPVGARGTSTVLM